MYKLLVMYHQPEDKEKWDEHYFNVHIPLAAKVPNTKILTTSKNGIDEMEGDNPYYLIAEMVFDSKEEMQAAFKTPEGIASHNDFMSFAEGKVTMVGFEVQDHKIESGYKQ